MQDVQSWMVLASLIGLPNATCSRAATHHSHYCSLRRRAVWLPANSVAESLASTADTITSAVTLGATWAVPQPFRVMPVLDL